MSSAVRLQTARTSAVTFGDIRLKDRVLSLLGKKMALRNVFTGSKFITKLINDKENETKRL